MLLIGIHVDSKPFSRVGALKLGTDMVHTEMVAAANVNDMAVVAGVAQSIFNKTTHQSH